MTEPTIDPTTGKPIITNPPATDPPIVDPNAPPSITVPAEEWTAMKTRLDVFEKVGLNLNQPAPVAPAPIAPTGPTLVDQVSEIDTQVNALNTKIDTASAENQPISALLTQRDNLMHKRTRLQIKAEDIDPALASGVETINQLSTAVTKGNMPYLSIPEVNTAYKSALAGLPANQRMNPQMHEAAYNMAVGQKDNLDKILNAQKEEILRGVSPPPGNPPPASNARTKDSKGNEIPKPNEVLSKDSLAAIAAVGKTPDQYYKGLGHKDGWAGFWEKTGKKNFAEPTTA